MAKKKESSDEAIVKQAVKCLKGYQDREHDNIKRAEEAIRFRALEQWPTQIKNDRENTNQEGGARPCPVLDKTNQYVRQIINEERQNRAAIRVRPVDDKADKKVAEIYTGIIRHIEDASEAIQAYTTAGEHAVDGGFGYIRVITEYCDDMSFDQDIRIKRIHNRFSVALGQHNEPDGADAKEALIWEDMPRADFKVEYPNAKEVGFEVNDSWADEDNIRVAEYMCIKQTPMKINLMESGDVLTDEELAKANEMAESEGLPPVEPIDTRQSTKKTVHWYKVTREEILEERTLVGTYIPVVKVTGNELTMPDGTIRTSGAIEAMMDPQRLHNYAHAGFIEHVALAPRAPWVASEESVDGYEADYAEANRKPIALLKFKQFDEAGHPLMAPTRTPPAGISSGWQQMLQNTEHGIESAVGMFGPSVGSKSQEKSGIALQEQKAQGMIGNYHFPDNLARSVQQVGRILLQWIPKYYDTERVARILGEDGEADIVNLNPNQEQAVMPYQDQMGNEEGISYNLNIGKYDLTVSTGPSYTSKRQEASEQQLQVIQARPEMLEIIGDIVFSNMDTPGSEDIAERLKTLLPPPIQELEANKGGQPVDPQTRMLMQQMKQADEEMKQREQMLMQAESEISAKAQEVNSIQKEVESALKQLDLQKKLMMAEARVKQAELDSEARDLMENKPDTDILKIQADLQKHDREMKLKEYEASVRMSEEGELVDETTEVMRGLADMINNIGGQLEEVTMKIDTPKSIEMERDENGELYRVNGRLVIRDDQNNMVGLE